MYRANLAGRLNRFTALLTLDGCRLFQFFYCADGWMMNFRSSDPAVKLKEKRLPIFGCLFEFTTGIANHAFPIVSMSLLFFTILLLISLLSGCGWGLLRLSSSVWLTSFAQFLPTNQQASVQTVGNRLNLRDPVIRMIGQVAARAETFAVWQVNAFQALRSLQQPTAQQFALQEKFFLQRVS